MKTDIINAIKILTAKISPTIPGDEALRITQAALNLAHTLSIVTVNEKA